MNVDQIEFEIAVIRSEMQVYAEAYGMSVDTFMNSLDRVEPHVAEAIVPLLIRKIDLLKLQWKLEVEGDQDNNVLLFSRMRSED